MSLTADGYIAGPDGSFDWAVPSEELHRFHNERVAAIDVQLLGRRSGARWRRSCSPTFSTIHRSASN